MLRVRKNRIKLLVNHFFILDYVKKKKSKKLQEILQKLEKQNKKKNQIINNSNTTLT